VRRAQKTETTPRNPQARDTLPDRETTFGETGEGRLLESKWQDRKLPERGSAILAQLREESIGLRLGGTEVPLPGEVRAPVPHF
jgi:hypothetical protein